MSKVENIDRAAELVALAKRYAQIALQHDCKTAAELSQRTFAAREAGEDIPYLGVVTSNLNYAPRPLAGQRRWQNIVNVDMLQARRSPEGHTCLWVNVLMNGPDKAVYEILVVTKWSQREGVRASNRLPDDVLFSCTIVNKK